MVLRSFSFVLGRLGTPRMEEIRAAMDSPGSKLTSSTSYTLKKKKKGGFKHEPEKVGV